MAVRARLTAPPPEPDRQWPFHQAKSRAIPASAMFASDRRMEAATYLSTGYGTRVAIENQKSGWVTFGTLAHAWAPPRIKTILVERQYGVPYLNTSQVFDIRPSPRKWLSFEKTQKAESRLAKQGTILVMASASPGRSTLVTAAHEDSFISHHFMRVEPLISQHAGWIYGFLKSPQGQAMMRGSQYASIIRHIEPHHLAALPVPSVPDNVIIDFNQRVERILNLRNEAFRLAELADERFSEAVGPIEPYEPHEGFVVNAAQMFGRRRRLEACYHVPVAAAIVRLFKQFDRLRDITNGVWWMSRFKRFYGDGGLPYLSADELFSINPEGTKKILVDPDDNHRDYFVEPGWIMMACSGQVYGLNGAAVLMTEHHTNTFFSHDLIRIIPDISKVRAGYLVVALTHRTHGRPLLIRCAYGTSIPHLDPEDVADFPVIRLSDDKEAEIAEIAEASAKARLDADVLERKLGVAAGEVIDQFITARLAP